MKKVIFHADGILLPPPLPTELPSFETNEGVGPPRGNNGPTFDLTTSEVLSIFLRVLGAATTCASGTCSTISFHDNGILAKFGM